MKNYLNPLSLLKLYIPPLYMYSGVEKMDLKNILKPRFKDLNKPAKNTQPLSRDEVLACGWVILQGEEDGE
jgi:hypothetical protein